MSVPASWGSRMVSGTQKLHTHQATATKPGKPLQNKKSKRLEGSGGLLCLCVGVGTRGQGGHQLTAVTASLLGVPSEVWILILVGEVG